MEDSELQGQQIDKVSRFDIFQQGEKSRQKYFLVILAFKL